MRVVQFLVADSSYVATLSRYSRENAAVSAEGRLDYSTNFPGCPASLEGKGEAPLEIVRPALGDNQKHGAEPAISAGALVSGKWRIVVPVEDISAEEVAAAFEVQHQNKLAALSQEFERRRNAGVIVSGNLYATTNDGHQELKALKERLDRVGGTQKAVTRAGDKINANAAQATAIFTAVDDYIAACWTREYDLRVAIDSAADQAALDAIDLTTGWPE